MTGLIALLIVVFTMLGVVWLDRSGNRAIRKVLNWIPAILFAYIIPALFTHLFRLDLSGVWLHQASRHFIMPLAIVMVMSALSFRQLKAIGMKPILVFLSGSFAVAILPVVLLLIFNQLSPSFNEEIIGEGYWRGLVTIVGSWIGGSTSQLVLKEIVACPESIFLVILVMDNVLVNIWTILMFQLIKRSETVNRLLKISDKPVDFIPDEVSLESKSRQSIYLAITLCLALVLLCFLFIESFLMTIILLSLAGLLLGNFIPQWNHAFVIKAGGFLIIAIMAILGLRLDFTNFSLPVYILLFAAVWLILHYLVMTLTAFILNTNMAWVPIGSMANVGGISTAPAVTKSYNEEWMPHAILLAILSMVTGTYWGMLTIYLFEHFLL